MPRPRARKHGCPRGRRRQGSKMRRLRNALAKKKK
jgi:hypothetical protein